MNIDNEAMHNLQERQARLAQLQQLQHDAQQLIHQSDEFLVKAAEVQAMEEDFATIE